MEVFGYTEEIVKPVLRNLLNLYNKNWKLIEDENYSALLESIIDSEESKVCPIITNASVLISVIIT